MKFLNYPKGWAHIQKWLTLLVFWSLSTGALAHARSAGCLISIAENDLAPRKVLFVKDIWSRRFSLPGGTAENNETPAETAEREVFEETGIRVNVGRELIKHEKFRVFECEPRMQTSVLRYPDSLQMIAPKDAKNEIEKIFFLDPKEIAVTKLRFPSQQNMIINIAGRVAASRKFEIENDRLSSASLTERRSIKLSHLLQTSKNKFTIYFFRILSFFSEEYFLYLTLPFFWFFFQWQTGAKFALLMLFSSLTNGLLKHSFEWGRPFEFDPSVQLMDASGFGFPSGHSQNAMVFWGYLYWILRTQLTKRRLPRWIKPTCIALILGGGISRIYLGVHFIHDVLFGWFFGALLVLEFVRIEKKSNWSLFWDTSHRHFKTSFGVWLVTALASLALRPHREVAMILCVWLGTSLGLAAFQKARERFKLAKNAHQTLSAWFISSAGLFIIAALAQFFTPTNRTFLVSLLSIATQYIAMGFWISFGSLWIRENWMHKLDFKA